MGGNAAGYTGSSINLRNALTAEGVEFTEKARVVLHYCHPADCFPISGKTNLLWSMYEGEPLPPIFAAKFARVHAVIAPSQFVYDLFKPHVGKKPLVVSHIGFDDSLYTYKERSWEPGKGQFEFLWVGAPNPRKGWPATFSSWAHLFQDKEWAHLTMKTSSETGKGTLRHFGNATFDSRLYTREEMRDLYHQANAFVFPTAGEGFGLCVSFSTLITTESGTIPMSDVLVGHRVLTGDGTYSDVVDKLTRTSWTRRVSVQGAPELTITPEHPFLSVKRNGARKLKLIDCSNPNWLRADELEKGDLVAFPRLRLSHGIARLDVMNYIDSQRFESNDEHVWSKWGYSSKTQCSLLKIQKKYRCSKRIAEDAVNICRGNLGAQGRNLKTTGTVAARLSVCLIQNGDVSYSAPVLMKRYVDIDDDFMLLVGWYLAEGSSKRAVEIDCHANEVPGLNQLASIIFDKFGLNSKNHKSLDTLKDILEGNDEIILELGKLLSDMSSSSGAAQLDELIRDYYKQFSADLSSGHSHHEEGGDVTEEMDHARVTHSDFFKNLGKINISSESLKNEEVAQILKIWLGGTDSTFENLISKLQRVDPQDAIRILTDATKAAGGPANGGDLSHKTKEVIGALFTQIPAVASIVHLVKKVIDPIEDSLLKRNAILGVSGIMSGIADNVAAYLFALAMLKDMYRQSYGPDIFEKVPQLIIAVDNAAMNVAEDQGGLSKVGNAPAIGQEVPKGEFMTEVNGLFRKVKVNLVPYTLGKSMIKNGYGHANFLFSLLASNSFISAGEYFLNKYLDLNLPK